MNARLARAGWARGLWGRRAASRHGEPPPDAVDVAELLRDASSAEEGAQEAVARRPPARCSVLLFPGQGSQAVGMGGGLLGFPRVRQLYEAAHRVLGYDLLELCLRGPQEDLDRTVHCQPAVFVASLAAVEKLHYLQPAALQFLRKNSAKYHFRRTKMLPVSGGFHTCLMEPAVEPLVKILDTINIKKPLVAVHSNVSGHKYMHPQHIRKLLGQQVVSPVKWEQTMHCIYKRKKGTEFPSTFEVGPGRQLGSILKSCNGQAWKSYSHVDVMQTSMDPDHRGP